MRFLFLFRRIFLAQQEECRNSNQHNQEDQHHQYTQRLLLTGLSTPAANVVVVSSVPCPAVAGREVSGGIVEALTVVVAFIVVGMAGSVVEVCTGVVDAAAPALTRNTSTSPAL